MINIILIIGVMILCFGVIFNEQKEIITYRYIPRSLKEEEEEPVYVSEIFEKMFSQQSPWVSSSQDLDVRKVEALNKYFVSQY
jgi:hypothetical protein